MPVIVVGADSEVGKAVIARLQTRAGEVRAFVSDRAAGDALRAEGAKVAVGDVSDFSHVGAAAAGAFSAVLVCQAATDGRETAFADPRYVVEGWLEAVQAAGVERIIVVAAAPVSLPAGLPPTAQVSTKGQSLSEVAEAVAALDDAPRL